MEGLEKALEDAEASGDPTQIWQALTRTNIVIMRCQYKTGQRFKQMSRVFYLFITFIVAYVFGSGGEPALSLIKMIFGK